MAIVLKALERKDVGKGASRRLRRTGCIPGSVYGADLPVKMISLEHKDLIKQMDDEDFYSQILELNINGKVESVIVKDIQRHAFKPKVEHLDLMRIKAGSEINVMLPLHFINEDIAVGVKKSNIELDQIVHMSDIKLPKGVDIVELSHGEGHDQPIAAIHLAKTSNVAGDEDNNEQEGGSNSEE